MSASAKDDSRAAGRGVAFIGLAKIYFMMAGAAIEVLLPSLLGKVIYGAYSFVGGTVSTINNVVVTGTIQAVSRETTADPQHAERAKATGLALQLRLGLPLALAFAAAAPLIAYLAHDMSKVGPLVLAAAIIAGYSIYAVLVGAANGTRQFHKQAGLDVTFATLRAGGILLAAALGFGVYGAIGAWVAAVGAIIMVSFAWVGGPAGARPAPLRPLFIYLSGLAAYLILTNLLLFVDTFMLKRTAARYFLALGHDAASAASEADAQVGLYTAALKLARLPYQLMLAVTFVIFPLVSRATFENDREKVKGYVRGTLRMSLLVAGALGTGLAAHSEQLLTVPFKAEFAREAALAAGPALAALALGHVALAIFSIGGTVLNSAGLTRQAVTSAALTVAVLLVSITLVLPRFTPGREMLTAAALCTSGSMLLGALFTGGQLIKHFGAFLPVVTAVRVVAAIAAAFAVCRFVPVGGKIFALGGAIAGGLTYLVMLLVTGELGKADLDKVLAVVRRRKS